jgi:hypothetical protein
MEFSNESSGSSSTYEKHRSLAVKGFENTLQKIFEEIKDNLSNIKVDPTIDLNNPNALAVALEQEMYDLYTTENQLGNKILQDQPVRLFVF